MPTSKILTILASAAWIVSILVLGLELAGFDLHDSVLQFVLAGAVCLVLRARLEKNGVAQVKAALKHGQQLGTALERREQLEQTAKLVTVAIPASGRAKVPDRSPAQIQLPGQRPIN